MFFLVVLSLLCAVLSYFVYKDATRDYWKKRNIVQVDGTFWNFSFGKESLAEHYKRIYDKYPKESYVGIFTGRTPTLLVKELKDVQAVLAGEFHSFHNRGLPFNPNDILSNNVLLMNDYKTWKLVRQKLTPLFTTLKMKNLYYIMDKCAQDFVERVKEDPKFMTVPFDALITYTTANVAATVFGINAKIKNTMDSPLVNSAKSSLKLTLRLRLIFALSTYFPKFLTTFNLKTFQSYENLFVEGLREVIESRKSEKVKRHDFVDLCVELQEQGPMVDKESGTKLETTVELLAAQGYFFFLAGTDTSANVMNTTLMILSSNPEILERLHKEIDDVIDSYNGELPYDGMEKLQYLDMVLNESMRKYPPVGVMQRLCTRETIMPTGGVKVENGTLVAIPVMALQRDQKYFPKPEVFDPERFSPENSTKIPNYAYMPFGDGNRICLGARYARLQMKSGLAWLLREFTLKQQPPVEPVFEPSTFALKDVNLHYDLIPRRRLN